MNFQSMRGALASRISGFLHTHLPKRTKRLVGLASLGAHLKGTTSLDDQAISKLNTIMALGSRDSALKLPVQLSKVIWNGRAKDIRPKVESPDQSAVKVVQDFPRWLRYDDEGTMRADVEALIGKFA